MASSELLRQRLRRLHRGIWRRHRAEIGRLVGDTPDPLKAYETACSSELRAAAATPIDAASAFDQLAGADVVLCGDFHSFRPTQQACGTLLERMTADARVVLQLEFALSEHQHYLDQYASGALDEAALLERLDYANTWGFGWSSYRDLLDLARADGVRVMGLNGPGDGSGDLTERDRWAAAQIARVAREQPRARQLVLIGDMHLATGHLPAAIAEATAGSARPLRVARLFQNSDELYWRLHRGGAPVEAARLGEDTYCLFSGTPWEKLESYLTWLEAAEVPDEDLHGWSGEGDPDPTDHVLELARTLGRLLALPFDPDAAPCVYTPNDLASLGDRLAAPTLERALSSDVYLIPPGEHLLLSRLDLAHAAEAAGELLIAQQAPPDDTDESAGIDPFLRRSYRRTLSYLASKLLVPVRRPSRGEDAPIHARRLMEGWTRVLPRALDRGDLELTAVAADDDTRLHHRVSRALGQHLGERVHGALLGGLCGLSDVRELCTAVPRGADLGRCLADLGIRVVTARHPRPLLAGEV